MHDRELVGFGFVVAATGETPNKKNASLILGILVGLVVDPLFTLSCKSFLAYLGNPASRCVAAIKIETVMHIHHVTSIS